MKEIIVKIHKLLVIVPALVHLMLIPYHTTAMVALSTDLCGFAMFMFILVGLACLFNATRVDNNPTIKQLVLSTVCLAVTIGFGIWLCTFYTEGLSNELTKNKEAISLALTMSIALIAVYGAGVVSLFMMKFMNTQKKEINQE